MKLIKYKARFRIFVISVVSLLLLACSEPQFDGSSSRSVNQSLNNIRESLPANKLKRFNSSISGLLVHFSGAHNADKKKELIELIDGKTGLEIIAVADKVLR